MIDMNDPEVIDSLKYLLIPKDEKIRTSARPFDSKKNFFVPHKTEGYLTAEVISEDGDNVTLINSQNEVICTYYIYSLSAATVHRTYDNF